MQTPHQVLGLTATAAVFALFLLGVVLAVLKRRSAKAPAVAADGTVLPPRPQAVTLPAKIHRWGGRGTWVLMVVAGGL